MSELPGEVNYDAIPAAIYTSPEVASVGLTEERAGQSHAIRVGRFPFRANGKAVILNDLEGMVKIISDRATDEVLGVQIIGPHATDLIAEAEREIARVSKTGKAAKP